ncbi:MAG: DUF4942 domain-containing protein [Syntrophothermus sp.]
MFRDNKNFYPTPESLIYKMLRGIDFKNGDSILEPSAGKGDILNYITNQVKGESNAWYNKKELDIDCIELDSNLQAILKENYRVVHDDFLTFNTFKQYDYIIMNPPFEHGEKHLLKALSLQEGKKSTIVCLLNAETLKNPFSNERKDLVRKLDELNASIEYIENSFTSSERKTGVEIALIKIQIEKKLNINSFIFDELKKEDVFNTDEEKYSNDSVMSGDFIKQVVEMCNNEIKAGIHFIQEYNAIHNQCLNNDFLINIGLASKDDYNTMINGYIRQVRKKYWSTLFKNEKFTGMLTNNLRQEFYNKVNELQDYDFSLRNIYAIKIEMNSHMIKGVEETIISLFDEFSHKHYWDNGTSKNIHYFNGWKTNSAFKINKKVIIPLNGFHNLKYSWGGYRPTQYGCIEKIEDIEKALDYLQYDKTEDINLKLALEKAEKELNFNVETKYFKISFKKKGTAHITFKHDELLKKFNIFGCQRKGWLPGSFGKKKFEDMTIDEQMVVDGFCDSNDSEKEYNNIVENKEMYILENANLLMIEAAC